MKVLDIVHDEQTQDRTREALQKKGLVIEKFADILIQQVQIDKLEGDQIMGNKQAGDRKIEVLVRDTATIHGDFVVADSMKDSFDKAVSAGISDELKRLLKDLSIAVGTMTQELSKQEAEDVAEDLETLVEQATREKPKRKWWSVSVDGLTQAAKNIGKVGEPVIDILKRIVPLLIAR